MESRQFCTSVVMELKIQTVKFCETTPETRRLRGDLIEVFKIFEGYDDICEDIFFVRSESNLRGYPLKLHRKNC